MPFTNQEGGHVWNISPICKSSALQRTWLIESERFGHQLLCNVHVNFYNWTCAFIVFPFTQHTNCSKGPPGHHFPMSCRADHNQPLLYSGGFPVPEPLTRNGIISVGEGRVDWGLNHCLGFPALSGESDIQSHLPGR